VSASIYRDHADLYARVADSRLPNSGYDRPAILRLAGDLAGRRVLELGSAAGGLTELLVGSGATVLGLDREPAMVERARERLGDAARFDVADLEQPLDTVEDASVDVVVASLVLHYLADWSDLLAEVRRALVPGGVLVFSIHHPITGWALSDQADYHRIELVHERWDWGDAVVTADMYRRPISAVFAPLREAGFAIDVVDEPLPVDTPAVDDSTRDVLMTQPIFLFVRARSTHGA
jgi:SAM-dependent methyltransferase